MTFPSSDTFSVWAPTADAVGLVLDSADADPIAMHRAADGWWTSTVAREVGRDYGFVVTGDDGEVSDPRPDPRSRRQPHGVHGLSRVHRVDASRWTDHAWTGRQLAGSVIYEMHVGTFSPGGTLTSAIEFLDELVELGVDMVEVMPVNAFNGEYGWGYDGVAWFAVHEPYGGPDAFQEFVNACHARGLGVCLDVVYNHLGPSGNYLPEFGPYLSAADGPWGAGLNLDGPHSGEVRRYIIDNALRWFDEFHVDALRLDAVHALHDASAVHLLEQLAVEVESLSTHLGRPLSLVAESDQNDPRLVTAREGGGYGLQGQWDDDVHHAVHAAVSGERQGYYSDFGSLESLRQVLTGAFLHAGTWSAFRGRVHGRPVDVGRVPGSRFVAYTLTHDQVGNRAAGDRPSMNLTPAQQLAKAAIVLCSPFTPMLFQGEEWGARTPFCFFTSHSEPELADAVRQGRTREFAEMGWDPATVADPQDPATFRRSVLDRSEQAEDEHAEILRVYRALIALRRSEPDLSDPWLGSVWVDCGVEAEDGRWLVVHRGSLALVVNLGTEPSRVPLAGEAVLVSGAVADDDSVFCQAFGFAVVRTRREIG
ncbi:malto-oligosyltrehalose trehalohydrolase [Dietzia psychralcaliphila]|uniref:malto-oligosyltrehalose trehalohydrolase n=1 Tax=Dietzia psychralcaliphila TaxID=139021 RepID=UPI001C1E738D|nr:malto-oligosyltrehalose trehalohydrolase [Dietzia psychralcaliphila]